MVLVLFITTLFKITVGNITNQGKESPLFEKTDENSLHYLDKFMIHGKE